MNKWKIIGAFAAVYIIWGSTYIVILFGIKGIPPFLMSAVRFLVAGILLYGWCLAKGEKTPKISSLKINSVCGILMLFGGTVSVAWAEQYISSSLAAIVVTALPFWFVVLDKKQWTYYFSNKIIITGLFLGFIGIMLLLGFNRSIHSGQNNAGSQLAGVIAILSGGIAWTLGSLYTKYRPTPNSLLMNGAIQFLAAGLFCLIVSLFAGEWRDFSPGEMSLSSLLALAYLITMGSLVAYLSYLFLLSVKPPAQVSTYVYVNPVVALLLGTIILGERIGWIQIIALAIILGGVLLVNLSRYKFQSS